MVAWRPSAAVRIGIESFLFMVETVTTGSLTSKGLLTPMTLERRRSGTEGRGSFRPPPLPL